MTTKEALLAAILEDPGDTKARLVYADYLQEHGDPRGELIALQCLHAEPDGDALHRIVWLLSKHQRAWTAAFAAKSARWSFRRGFIEKLTIDAEDLLVHGAAILRAEPIDDLEICNLAACARKRDGSRLTPILALPLQRIRRLTFATKLALADLEALAETTALPNLRELVLEACWIRDFGMQKLAASTTLPFTHLVASWNGLTGIACDWIAYAPWAAQLSYLDVSGNFLPAEDIDQLRAVLARVTVRYR